MGNTRDCCTNGGPILTEHAVQRRAALGRSLRRAAVNIAVQGFCLLACALGAHAAIINVRDFGAKGDGKADDGPAIRAALAAAATAGGGTVYLPAGVYRGSVAGNPENADYRAVGMLPSGVKLLGDGMGSTVVGLLPNLPNGSYVFLNSHIGSGGDHDIVVEDLTVDGFAGEQHPQYGQNGLSVLRMQNLICRRVRFRNVCGTASSGPGESFHVEFGLSTGALFDGCEVVGNAGSTASGFSADSSTEITYVGCRSYGMKVSCGFTHNACSHVTYIGCHSYLNPNGFNSEVSRDVTYSACTAGGETTKQPAYPYPPGTSLGNRGPYGQFILNGDHNVQLVGCTAERGSTGVWVQNGGSIRIMGGVFSDNRDYGVHINAEALPGTQISGKPLMERNGKAALDLPIGRSAVIGELPAPPLPQSDRELVSPFPIPAVIVVTGSGIAEISIDGVPVLHGPGTAPVAPGSRVRLRYSKKPRWRWLAG